MVCPVIILPVLSTPKLDTIVPDVKALKVTDVAVKPLVNIVLPVTVPPVKLLVVCPVITFPVLSTPKLDTIVPEVKGVSVNVPAVIVVAEILDDLNVVTPDIVVAVTTDKLVLPVTFKVFAVRPAVKIEGLLTCPPNHTAVTSVNPEPIP